MKQARWRYYLLFLIGVASLLMTSTPGMAQTVVTREEFSQYLQQYIEQLQQIMASGDTTFSEPTSLEMRTRQWNDFVVKNMPKRFAVKVPIDNVTLKKQKYNRAEVEIDFSFMVNFPEQNFRFEDNLPEKNIELLSLVKDLNGQGWYEIIPAIDILVIEANQARKYSVVKNKGYLLFGIKLALSREAGWTQFYQTVISFDWVKWQVDDGTIWEVEPLPIEDLFFKKEE
jgi:hypothetical protein